MWVVLLIFVGKKDIFLVKDGRKYKEAINTTVAGGVLKMISKLFFN